MIYRNFEYYKERSNRNGTTSWRGSMYKKLKCKERIVSDDQRIVSDRQPDHCHEGNAAISLGCVAVGEMKKTLDDVTVIPSAAV